MYTQASLREQIEYCEERINKGCSKFMEKLFLDSRSVLISALTDLQIKEYKK